MLPVRGGPRDTRLERGEGACGVHAGAQGRAHRRNESVMVATREGI